MDEELPKRVVYKIIIVGSWGAGKTSLRRAYMGKSLKKRYMATTGVDFSLKVINSGKNVQYNLLIYDIAGEDRYESVRDVYFQGAHGALVVFDLTRRESFDSIMTWVKNIVRATETKGVPLILLGNKRDLAPIELNQCATNAEIEDIQRGINKKYKNKFPIEYLDTSVVTGQNVNLAFSKLLENINSWIPEARGI